MKKKKLRQAPKIHRGFPAGVITSPPPSLIGYTDVGREWVFAEKTPGQLLHAKKKKHRL